MPTPEEVRAFQLMRAKFLGALYDAEPAQHQRMGLSAVSDILSTIGVPNLDNGQATRLIRVLEQSRVIEGMGQSMADLYSPEVRLTAYGRESVEAWVTAQTATSAELPLSYQTVYNTTIHSPQGTVINVGSTSTGTTINNQFGSSLGAVVAAAQSLLAQDSNLSTDDREEIEEDIATLEEQSTQPKLDKVSVKRALRNIARWAGASVAVAGSQELQHLTTQALQAIAG